MASDEPLDFDQEDRRRYVRMYDLFGQSVVPPDAAEVIEKAVRKAIRRGDVRPGSAWQRVELWAANYLAEVKTDRQERIREEVDEANTNPRRYVREQID